MRVDNDGGGLKDDGVALLDGALAPFLILHLRKGLIEWKSLQQIPSITGADVGKHNEVPGMIAVVLRLKGIREIHRFHATDRRTPGADVPGLPGVTSGLGK